MDCEAFKKLCENAENGNDVIKIAELYNMDCGRIYNNFIGWSLPTSKTS